MPESSGAVPPQFASVLNREYPMLVQAVGKALDMTYPQQRAAMEMNPTLWVPWTTAVLGGDDLINGLRMDDPILQEMPSAMHPLMGAEAMIRDIHGYDYRQGVLAQRAQELYAKNNPGAQSRLERLSSACARFMVSMGSLVGFGSDLWRDNVRVIPQTYVNSDTRGVPYVEFNMSDERYAVGGPAKTIVTYGPGTSGGSLAGMGVGQTEAFHFVSGGMGGRFVNRFIDAHLKALGMGLQVLQRIGPARSRPAAAAPRDASLPETFFYDNGIAEAAGRITAKVVEQGKPVDVVLMSAVHSAGAEECVAGVEGAHAMLRDSGLLVVKAPRVSIGNEGGLDVVAPVAHRLFGGPAVAGECGLLGQYTDPNLPIARPADFVIYRK